MKKFIFALFPATLTIFASVPDFEIARFEGGKHGKIPASAGFSMKKTVKKQGVVTEHHLEIANKGKDVLRLRLRAKLPAGNAGGAYL